MELRVYERRRDNNPVYVVRWVSSREELLELVKGLKYRYFRLFSDKGELLNPESILCGK